MPEPRRASEAQAEEACRYLRKIIEAAENSNQAGGDAVVRAAGAVRLPRAEDMSDAEKLDLQPGRAYRSGSTKYENYSLRLRCSFPIAGPGQRSLMYS